GAPSRRLLRAGLEAPARRRGRRGLQVRRQAMLEPQLLGIGARHLERLVIALSGALAIWLGYRLFLSMPLAEKGTGRLPLPGVISIFMSRVGPGVFFALFGAGVLAYGLHQEVRIDVGPPPALTGP